MLFGLSELFSKMGANTSTSVKHVVGIDIGSSSIKIVELIQNDNIITLKTYGELQLGPYGKQDLGKNTRLELEQQIEALVDVLRESKATATSGVMTLQLSTSFVTVFSVHAKTDEDLNPKIQVEARKYIPVPMSDVTLDWSELPILGNAIESVREVLVVAVQHDTQAETFKLLQAVNMTSQPTEIEIFSSLRAVSRSDDSTIVIIDLGAETSKLYIAHEGVIRKIHRVFAGGAKATESISKMLEVSFEEAENIKRNYSADAEHASVIKKEIVSIFERPLQEFKRVINQFESKSTKKVSRIIITGGSSSFIDMHKYVSYMLDRDVEQANPFTKVSYPVFMEDTLEEIAPIFTVALGAALRPFETTK